MLEIFSNTFQITDKSTSDEEKEFYKNLPLELFKTLDMFGGSTFNNGLYRIHSFKSSIKWASIIADCFSAYRHKIYPFGFDWMGRQFCINTSGDAIFMFDPVTFEDLKSEEGLISFHNETLVNGLLAPDLFSKVLASKKISSIGYNECLGFTIPLFLGGKDNINNYKNQDIEVYWSITFQIYQQVKDLPEGTKIRDIKVE